MHSPSLVVESAAGEGERVSPALPPGRRPRRLSLIDSFAGGITLS
jgi:hypothetical protein